MRLSHAQDHEPRILNIDLAERLGLAQLLNIRSQFIKTNIAGLAGLGTIVTAPLNEEQAILVAVLSRAT